MPETAKAATPEDRSVSEVRDLVDRAHAAFLKFQHFTVEQVDQVIDAMAAVATANAEKLARLAVEETGYGRVEDKIQKNLFASQRVYEAVRAMKTVGVVREDAAAGVIEVAVPVGVVAAILPSTNPTSTAIYKILIALKGRNAIVVSPHPSAMRCTCEVVSLMRQAAIQAGAPEDVICCFTTPSQAGTQELMKHRRTAVVLATGGMGIVRAAYSSGKPAFGVGPGNVAAFIERSADVKKAVADVVFGKTFDYGTICSSEQAIVAEEAVRQSVMEELRRNEAYFLTPEEIDTLGKQMVNLEAHTINPKFVGKSAPRVAELAGFRVPEGTRVLVAQLAGVGREHPLSAEKLSPVLALYFAPDRAAAFDLCERLLRFGGLGHTVVIHSRDEQAIREFGVRMPAGRIVVNSPAPQGSIGATTNLFPAMTLGCGAMGGNITSDNISPMHLVNLKRVAYEKRPVTAAEQPVAIAAPAPAATAATACACAGEKPVEPVVLALPERIAAARAVERFLARKPAAAAAPAPPAAPVAPAPAAAVRPKPRAVDFVSVAEVEVALKRKQKILIGPRTIITPAARDLAAGRDVLVPTES
ncbi:MAG TPA: aldehyde dehydrogenase family protein [Terriglobales bacterium]|nr:aldehyde dehydrogenase family protein [Terriglobales bacterium]